MYRCTDCGVASSDVTPSWDPRFASGKCASCGYKERMFRRQVTSAPPPPSTGDANSDTAASMISSMAGTKREEVYQLLLSGPRAEWQLEQELGWPGNTVRPRLWELEKMGLVQKGPDRNTTPTGRPAWLYRVK